MFCVCIHVWVLTVFTKVKDEIVFLTKVKDEIVFPVFTYENDGLY